MCTWTEVPIVHRLYPILYSTSWRDILPNRDPWQQIVNQDLGEPKAAMEEAIIQAQLLEKVAEFPNRRTLHALAHPHCYQQRHSDLHEPAVKKVYADPP